MFLNGRLSRCFVVERLFSGCFDDDVDIQSKNARSWNDKWFKASFFLSVYIRRICGKLSNSSCREKIEDVVFNFIRRNERVRFMGSLRQIYLGMLHLTRQRFTEFFQLASKYCYVDYL